MSSGGPSTPLKEGLPPPLDPVTAAAVAHLNSLAWARALGASSSAERERSLKSSLGGSAEGNEGNGGGAPAAGSEARVSSGLMDGALLVPPGTLEGGDKSRKKRSPTHGQLVLPPGCQVCQLSLNEIAEATNYFSPAQLIGSGGFGPVFRGQLHGTTVAVKKRDEESLQGDDEFFNEVSASDQPWALAPSALGSGPSPPGLWAFPPWALGPPPLGSGPSTLGSGPFRPGLWPLRLAAVPEQACPPCRSSVGSSAPFGRQEETRVVWLNVGCLVCAWSWGGRWSCCRGRTTPTWWSSWASARTWSTRSWSTTSCPTGRCGTTSMVSAHGRSPSF